MWNVFIRLGMVMSTMLIGKQFVEHFWPSELRPTRLYRPHQIARYLGATTGQVIELIETGALNARWVGGRPLVLGVNVLDFLARQQ